MNPDQKANIKADLEDLSRTLVSAWSYFHALRGLHEGGHGNPEVLRRFSWLFDRVWRSMFEGLYSKIGTLLDNTKSTKSLPNMVKRIRRYGDKELESLLPPVESCLDPSDSPLQKIRVWRHKAVAHQTSEAKASAFYEKNKLYLDEVETALKQLEHALDRLSEVALGVSTSAEIASLGLVTDGRMLFSLLAIGVRQESEQKYDY